MGKKLWTLQIGVILSSTFLMALLKLGFDDRLSNPFLKKNIYPVTLGLANAFTDAKFLLRGKVPPKEPKIVILDIDNASVQAIGRWPWHRDVTAELIEKSFGAGARVIGLDMVFSEPDVRVSPEMQEKLESLKLGYLKSQVETDPLLARTIGRHSSKLVLGWTPQGVCQPLLSLAHECPLIEDFEQIEYPAGFSKFAVKNQSPDSIPPNKSFLVSTFDTLANLEIFNDVAKYSGFFQAFPDPDGVIRRAPLIQMVGGKAFPSLALEMARIVRDEELKVDLGSEGRLESLSYLKSGKKITTTSTSFVEFNSRGPGYTFPYVRALDVFSIGENVEGEQLQASQRAAALLQGAYVLVGLSALGAADLRAFTFDKVVPGVEGHATILDNLLADDFLRRNSSWGLVFLLALGGLIFSWFMQKLESIQGLILLLGTLAPLAFLDYHLFLKQQDWNFGFFYLELLGIYILTAVSKYISEEKDKKFLKKAFSRYVSAELVNSILKDPSKLKLQGERKNLTILFSDIRSFTSFSETMDAKQLSLFLNDYFESMTQIIFQQKGTVDKFIGDAIMAFWGAPLTLPHPASSACQSAVQMIQTLELNQKKYRELYGIDVHVGVGINSGNVNVGNMGSSQNFSYTVIGDQVNLASRVEGLTKYYGVSILTTRNTLDAIKEEGQTIPPNRSLDLVRVKGKSKSVELIQVLVQPLPEEIVASFARARQLYTVRDWTGAIVLFENCNVLINKETGKSDKACELFIKRCHTFLEQPPIETWDGSWDMLEK